MENNQDTKVAPTKFWSGLEEYYGDPAFMKHAEDEFMSSPLNVDDGKDPVARRDFLKLMGASLAMATTACVRRPVQHIIPYAQAPKDVTPGEANYYASTWFDGSEGYGLLVKTMEGRPLKLEGNPGHPMNTGKLPARAHAEVLAQYDPDRLKGPVRNLPNKNRTNKETIATQWADLDAKVIEALGQGSAVVLTSSMPSPSTEALLADFAKAHALRTVTWDMIPYDEVRGGQKRAYGKEILPRYRFDLAKMIVSIDCDFLGTYLSPTEFTRGYSRSRQPGPEMARLVVFESLQSLTGLNADDRVRIKPSQQLDVVLALMNEIITNFAKDKYSQLHGYLQTYNGFAAKLGADAGLFKKVAEQLWKNRGKSLVLAGGLTGQTAEAADLQMAVNALNSLLENDGATIDHEVAPYNTHAGSNAEMAKLIADMKDGKVKTLIINNVNPMYALPKESGFHEALQKVGLIVYAGNYNDETGSIANYIATTGTSLENWNDYELQKGVYSLQQPTIRPMYETRAFEDSLIAWTGKAANAPARLKAAATFHDYLKGIWKSEMLAKSTEHKSFDEFWIAILRSGVLQTGAHRDKTGGARTINLGNLSTKPRAEQNGLELVIYPKVHMLDGRYANIAWIQELPDPVTKVVWDNYLTVSPAMAKRENLKQGDLVNLKVGEKSLEVPVFVQPGQHDQVLGLAIGYGRKGAGRVANEIGHNAYQLASFAADGKAVFSGLNATIEKTGEWYELAPIHGHNMMRDETVTDVDRPIVFETTNEAFQKNPGSGIEHHKLITIWPQHQYTKHRWAMSVDLTKCTGCSACVIACQSENNVPVVGKKYILQGREMHWLRIDRYYKGAPDSPEAVFQPVMCQQCENAPCETVCPVLATVHNDEGLNDMVYNRCVGTRYCSNNCPYKVRRFNWFNYAKTREEPLHMAYNPDVTVRARGVMEKCTFCVQRIRKGTNEARDRKENLKDGEIQTACEQTCPADVFVFGDLNDPNSRVKKLFEDQRTYALLEELNTQPRVRYMSRIRNADRVIAEEGEGHGAGKSSEKQEQHKQEQHKQVHKEGGHS